MQSSSRDIFKSVSGRDRRTVCSASDSTKRSFVRRHLHQCVERHQQGDKWRGVSDGAGDEDGDSGVHGSGSGGAHGM
jgi:hypothetical protein